MTEASEAVDRLLAEPTNDPSARITRVSTLAASPGKCVLCGKHEHPLGFAATDGLSFEFYGTVYFCADCVGEYARLFGYLAPNDLASLREHIEVQNTELNTLRQAVLGLESTVDNLAGELARRNYPDRVLAVHDNVTGVVNSDVSDQVDEPDAGLSNDDVRESVNVPEKASVSAGEPVTEQGTDDLLGSASADELLGL